MGPTPPPLGAPGAARGGTLLAGRYRLDRPLASGGMAQVWTGRDEALGRPVAVKVLHPHLTGDATFVTRFRAEALAAARLAHPSVVAVYDTCSELGLEAIVMELIDGTTLRQRLDAERRLDPREAARIGARIADALGAAHAASIVHRDIKPANVLLATDGRVLVTDFGIAKAAESGDLTREHQMLGTVKYLAPEQVRAQRVDGRTDLYSLGVVLFEMVCGQVPFLADTDAGTALARLERDPPSPRALRPDLDPSFSQTILRAMARAPEHRWPDAASLGVALRALAAGRPAFVPVASPGPGAAAPARAVAAPAGAPAPEWRHPDPSPPTAPTPTTAGSEAHPRRRARTGPTLVAIVTVVVVPILLLALGWRLLGPGSTESVRPEVAAFDPFGTDGENDDQAGLAVDDDDDTAWPSERYDDPDITLLKPGVGLTLDLGETRSVQGVEVASPSSGWTAEVYVLDDPPSGDRNTWGPAAGTVESADGDARIDIDAVDGRIVLLWFTRAGDDGLVEVSEVRAVVGT